MIRTYRLFIIVAEKKDFFFQPYLIMDRIRNIDICKFKSTSSVILNETAEKKWSLYWLFYDGGRDHKEKSPLILSANQWAFFFMITASVMEELKLSFPMFPLIALKRSENQRFQIFSGESKGNIWKKKG